jgi:hypothetical protein
MSYAPLFECEFRHVEYECEYERNAKSYSVNLVPFAIAKTSSSGFADIDFWLSPSIAEVLDRKGRMSSPSAF